MLRKAFRGLMLLTAGACAVMLGSALGATPSLADTPDWFAPASPQLSLVQQLPSNTTPPNRNEFCSWIVYFPKNILTPATECVAETPAGYLSAFGNGLMVDNKTFVPLVPVAGRATYSPVPNSSKVRMTSYSTGTRWENIGFYNNLQRSDLQDKNVWCGPSCAERQLWVSRQPDFYASGTDGKPLSVNVADITTSMNGNWLVVDSPSGLLRVNLASQAHEVLPFAQSLAQLPYANQSFVQMAVSDDGQLIVVAQTIRTGNVPPKLWLYDLHGCTGKAVSVTQTIAEGCRVRDLWNGLRATDPHSSDTGLSKVFNNPTSIVNPRLVGSDNLSFDITYNKSGSSFDAASYTLTAPGGSLHGLGLLGMGDSYISGEGEFRYAKDTDSDNNHCHQSLLSYPFLLGAKLFTSYDSVACSGAITSDITNESDSYEGQVKDGIQKRDRDVPTILANMSPGYLNQDQFVSFYQPEAILLSIGGNDINFGDIVGRCVGVGTCYPTYEDRLELMHTINDSFNKLVATYQSILAASPVSHLYIVGYPQIAATGGSCGLNVHLNADEVQFSIDAINYLDSVIRQAATDAGAYYVDVSHALAGHELCEPGDKAVNGLTAGDDQYLVIGHESYHPTTLGHQLLAAAIDNQTDDLTAPMPTAQPSLGPPVISNDDPLLVHAPQGKSGRPTYDVTYTDNASKSIWERGEDMFVEASGAFTNFASNVPVIASLHSDPVYMGTFTTDANGNLRGTFAVPDAVPSGVHVLHLQGKDMGGNDISIEQMVYVAVSPNDYDGDGIPNTRDSCPYIVNSGIDADQDGIDDACDAEITDPPVITASDEENNGTPTVAGSNRDTTPEIHAASVPVSLQQAAVVDTLPGVSLDSPATISGSSGLVLGESASRDSAVAASLPNHQSASVSKSYMVYAVVLIGLLAALLGGFFAWLLQRARH